LDSSSDSETDSGDSSECSSSDSDDEDINAHQEEAARHSHSRNSNFSGDEEVDGGWEGRNGSGNLGAIVCVRNSEGIATVQIDREPTSVNSVSIHQNQVRVLTKVCRKI
jgi:hypothetical protein